MWRLLFLAGVGLSTAYPNVAVAAGTTGRNAALPSLKDVKPLPKMGRLPSGPDAGFVHDVTISVEGSYGETRHKAGQPANLRQYSTGTRLGVSAGIGDIGFASVSGSYSKEEISSTVVQFPLDLVGDAHTRGVDVVLGITPLPYLRGGFIGGLGNADAAYDFTAFSSPTDSSGNSYRYGGFLGASYLLGPVMLNVDATYLRVHNKQDYGPTNIPETAEWGGDFLAVQLGASYNVTPKLKLSGAVAFNHVLSQDVAPADTPMDENWASVQLRAGYMVTDQLELNVKGLAWLGNDKFDYNRVSIGASYKF